MTSEEKFPVWWDEKEGIVRNVSWGDREEEDAKREAAEILEVAESKPGKILILVVKSIGQGLFRSQESLFQSA